MLTDQQLTQYETFYRLTYINNEDWSDTPCTTYIYSHELDDYVNSPDLTITSLHSATYDEFTFFWENYEEEL